MKICFWIILCFGIKTKQEKKKEKETITSNQIKSNACNGASIVVPYLKYGLKLKKVQIHQSQAVLGQCHLFKFPYANTNSLFLCIRISMYISPRR